MKNRTGKLNNLYSQQTGFTRTDFLKKDFGGFTIIEVMIVLAIAAVIMVVVFLAVPNLQRSSRNTQRRTDANNILSVANEYKSDNSGAAPGCYILANGSFSVGSDTSSTCAKNLVSTKVSTQTTAPTAASFVTAVPGTLPATPANGTIIIYSGAQCTNNAPATGAGVVVWYSVEPGTISQCVAG